MEGGRERRVIRGSINCSRRTRENGNNNSRRTESTAEFKSRFYARCLSFLLPPFPVSPFLRPPIDRLSQEPTNTAKNTRTRDAYFERRYDSQRPSTTCLRATRAEVAPPSRHVRASFLLRVRLMFHVSHVKFVERANWPSDGELTDDPMNSRGLQTDSPLDRESEPLSYSFSNDVCKMSIFFRPTIVFFLLLSRIFYVLF